MRRILASLFALWAVFATTGVDATIYFCAGMNEVSQHPCCAGRDAPAGPAIAARGRDCCAAAHYDQDERTTFASSTLRLAVAVHAVDVPAVPVTTSIVPVARARARGPPRGPPIYLEHEALLI